MCVCVSEDRSLATVAKCSLMGEMMGLKIIQGVWFRPAPFEKCHEITFVVNWLVIQIKTD